jgi:hypothetical protein
MTPPSAEHRLYPAGWWQVLRRSARPVICGDDLLRPSEAAELFGVRTPTLTPRRRRTVWAGR